MEAKDEGRLTEAEKIDRESFDFDRELRAILEMPRESLLEPSRFTRTVDGEDVIDLNVEEVRAWMKILSDKVGIAYTDRSFDNFEVYDDDQERVLHELREFQREVFENVMSGRGLILFGNKGVGKDHLLSALMFDALRRYGIRAWYRNGREFFEQCAADRKRKFNPQDLSMLNTKFFCNVRLLVISDLTIEKEPLGYWEKNDLYTVVEYRRKMNLPTWYSFNVQGASEAEECYGGQIMERMTTNALILYCGWQRWQDYLKSKR